MIHHLDLWDAALACPDSLEEACAQCDTLGHQSPGVNPTFLALVLSLSVDGQESASEPRWLARRSEEARALEAAVWRLYTPEDDVAALLPAIIERATGLGLVVLSQALDLVFLPDGRVLPPDPSAPGARARVRIERALRADRPGTFARLFGTLQQLLEPEGFSVTANDHVTQAVFQRTVERGWQALSLTVKTTHGVDHADVWISVHDAPVEALFAAAFGVEAARTQQPAGGVSFQFTPSAFRGHRFGHIGVDNALQRQALVDDVARHGLPVLDLARSLQGLDRLMNQPDLFPYRFPGLNPREPQNLADDALNSALSSVTNLGRHKGLKLLVAAHLAGNPQFQRRVDDLRRFVQGRTGVTEADIDALLAFLATQPR